MERGDAMGGGPLEGSAAAGLYLVATPIGNLEDITHRAVRILGSVGDVFAEDTRRTRILLDHYGLAPRLHSLHQHNEAARAAQVVGLLSAGGSVALVSDAGTPLVSDPGERLVRVVAEAGHSVFAVPGPSAVLAALSVSGLPAEQFCFLGFAPRRGRERSEWLQRLARARETCVLFEAPGRVPDLLAALAEVCGPDRPAVITRELTKLHEEVRRGTLSSLAEGLAENPLRGEVTLVVAPGEAPGVDEESLREEARALLGEGTRPSRAAQLLSERLGIPRNQAYRVVQSVKDS